MVYGQQMQTLLDRTAIIELKNAYARHADAMDPDRMVSRFIETCTASYHPDDELIVGREALRDWYARRLGPVVASSHHLSNFEVDFVTPDHARLRCYLYSWQRLDGFPHEHDRHRWARYEDAWIRTADGWFQASLTYRVAGELSSGDVLRVGEYLR
jgi:hypothetical protein